MRGCFVALVVLACGCAPPVKNVPMAQIPGLTKLDDVMDVQATLADPQFKKIGAASYGDADWAAFKDAAERIGATSVKIKDFSILPNPIELPIGKIEFVPRPTSENLRDIGLLPQVTFATIRTLTSDIVPIWLRLTKTGISDQVMEIACGLHNLRVSHRHPLPTLNLRDLGGFP